MSEIQETLDSTHSSFRWRLLASIGVILLLNVVIFLGLVANFSTGEPQVARAQDGGTGEEPTDKLNPIDSYPNPYETGALPFSLRDPWDKTNLTYYFHNCPSTVDCTDGQNAVRIGFRSWEDVSALTFREVGTAAEADIEVQWTANHEGLGLPGDILAFAYFPRYGGDLFFDDSEPWTIGDGGDTDLVLVATHEIGHTIGLAHSEFENAIMFPYSGFATVLGQDDIRAVQALYGPPDGEDAAPSGGLPGNVAGTIPVAGVSEVEGNITNKDPYTVWDIEVEEGVYVTVTMQRVEGNLEPYVGILDNDLSDVLIESGDGNDDGLVSLGYTFSESGTYSVVTTRFGVWDGTTTGTYKLSVSIEGNEQPADVPAAPDVPEQVTWRVTNLAGTSLCYLYFSHSDSESWGTDRLGSEILSEGSFLDWSLAPGTYDIQVWDCFDNSLELYEVEATQDVNLQVYTERIQVVSLGTETPPEDEVPVGDDLYTWRISNRSTSTVCYLYFNPSSETTWGPDRLGTEVLSSMQSLDWELPRGTYDILVEDCGDNRLERYGIELDHDIEIQVLDNEIAVIALDESASSTAPGDGTYTWRVRNNSGVTICFLYFVPVETEGWGEDQLGVNLFSADAVLEWTLAPGTYNLRAEDCTGGSLELSEIDLNQHLELQIFSEEILVVPLE
jgi:hypothetical protein